MLRKQKKTQKWFLSRGREGGGCSTFFGGGDEATPIPASRQAADESRCDRAYLKRMHLIDNVHLQHTIIHIGTQQTNYSISANSSTNFECTH